MVSTVSVIVNVIVTVSFISHFSAALILEISFCPAKKKLSKTVRLAGPVQSLYFAIKLEFSYIVLVTATTHVKVMDFLKKPSS